MLPIKQKTKTSFAKNDPSQDLSKSKYVLVKTNDYMIFLRIKCCTLLNGVFFVFFNILFRFQFRDCEGNTLQLYCVPNSEKSHSYMSIERLTSLTRIIWSTGTHRHSNSGPPFSSFGPSRDYGIMVWIFVWKYIFEPFIHILQHFVLQLSRSTNFCF